jgi:hypothetical protein
MARLIKCCRTTVGVGTELPFYNAVVDSEKAQILKLF